MSENTLLKYKGYIGTINYSDEDKILYGKIECINDLIMYETTDATKVQEVFEEAVDDYLLTCQEVGKEPDKTYSGSFNVRITPPLHKKLHIESIKRNLSLNKIVTDALLSYFEDKNVVHHHHHHTPKQQNTVKSIEFDDWGSIRSSGFELTAFKGH